MTVEFEVPEPPTDGITSLHFSPFEGCKRLLATSWDSTASVYDCLNRLPIAKFHTSAGLLDGCFSALDRSVAYVAGLSREIHRLDMNRPSQTQSQTFAFGAHDDAIKAVAHCQKTGLLWAGSWDRSVGGWDERSSSNSSGGASRSAASCRLTLPDKVYSMDLHTSKSLLLVATAGRHIYLFDPRQPNQPLQKRESSLKYQTRQVRFFPDGSGFVCASVEGRVAVDFIDPSPEVQAARYAFKCHRSSVSTASMEVVHPVNAIACHPKYNCFMTGGGDGVVSSWDRIARKRIRQFPKYHSSIAALAIDKDGSHLAIASSYGYEEGEKDHAPDTIYIRRLEESDIRPASKGAAQ